MSQTAVQPLLPPVGRPVLAVIDAALTQRIDDSTALLRQVVADYGRVVYANSLGAEAIVLTDLICTAVPQIDIVTIDTGRLPEETLSLLERLERRYQRRIQVFYPDAAAVERYVREQGINGFYNGLQERLSCCRFVKWSHSSGPSPATAPGSRACGASSPRRAQAARPSRRIRTASPR